MVWGLLVQIIIQWSIMPLKNFDKTFLFHFEQRLEQKNGIILGDILYEAYNRIKTFQARN